MEGIKVLGNFTIDLELLAPIDIRLEAKHDNHIDGEPIGDVSILMESVSPKVDHLLGRVAKEHAVEKHLQISQQGFSWCTLDSIYVYFSIFLNIIYSELISKVRKYVLDLDDHVEI